MKTVAILSDTHGLLRPEVYPHLENVDHIFHAGDVGNKSILSRLEKYAPLTAILGNTDYAFLGLSHTELVEVAGVYFYLQHIAEDLNIDPVAAGVDVVINGHSHQPSILRKNGVLYLNPGSASYPRGGSKQSMILLGIPEKAALEPRILTLLP